MSKVEIIEKFFNEKEVNYLIELYNNTTFYTASCVVDNERTRVNNHRSCEQGTIGKGISNIIDKLLPLHQKYAKEELNIPIKELKIDRHLVPFRYEKDNFFNWHADWGDDDENRTRRISSIIQLSNPRDYEGGFLEFWNGTVSSKVLGTLLIFDSKDTHRVSIITEGIRKSCAIFSHWIKE